MKMKKALRVYQVEEARASILRRVSLEEVEVPFEVQASIRRLFGADLTPIQVTTRIIADVQKRGDAALREWTARLDGIELDRFEVPPEEVRAAVNTVDPGLVEALHLAADRVRAFHKHQPVHSWTDFGSHGALGQLVRPLNRVGIYVPGGTASLPSSLLMAAIPARVAGVSEIIVTSPPDRETGKPSPVILAAAAVADVERVFSLGGAQAIASLAYGTQTVPRVDKICGPGNLFVTLAKRQVYGVVGIDSLSGPTETLIIADESANPRYVAADLLAQAEHDIMATAILLTPSRSLAEEVNRETARQMASLSRASVIVRSLNRGGIVLTADLEEACALADEYAPEHLCLLIADPWRYVGRLRNAGGIFVGEYSFEVLGDYVAGPSHIMPTGGTARFASPLSVADFVKITSLVALDRGELFQLGSPAVTLAEAEGLTAHAQAVRARLTG